MLDKNEKRRLKKKVLDLQKEEKSRRHPRYKSEEDKRIRKAGSEELFQKAKADYQQRKVNEDKDTRDRANDMANYISGVMKGRVSKIGGFGIGKPNICQDCGERKRHLKGEFIKGKLVYRCDKCRSKNAPEKVHLKIIIN